MPAPCQLHSWHFDTPDGVEAIETAAAAASVPSGREDDVAAAGWVAGAAGGCLAGATPAGRPILAKCLPLRMCACIRDGAVLTPG